MSNRTVWHISARSLRTVFLLAACSAAAWLFGQNIDLAQVNHVHAEPSIYPVKPGAPARLPAMNQTQASGSDPISPDSPIFHPSPRPSPEPISEPQAVMKSDQYRLLGIAIFGDDKRALLLEAVSGAAQVVAEGEMINGMQVERITPEQITLSMNGGREHLGITAGPAITAACSDTGAPCVDTAAAELAPSETPSNAVDPRTAEFRAERAQRRLARAVARATQ